MAIYQTYKGATLVLKMSTEVPESGTRVSLSGYEIQVKAQGYSATVEVVDQYNVKAIFAASTTEKFLVGSLPVVAYLTKDGKTAVGKAEGVVVLDPSSRGLSADSTDQINVSMDVSTIEAIFDVTLNGVFAYEDLTTEQREEIISGITAQAEGLFVQLNSAIDNANEKIEETKQATLAAKETAEHPTYIGQDHYVYVWNYQTDNYEKTNIYCKGDKGDVEYATFYLDHITGCLKMIYDPTFNNVSFSIKNGNLILEINTL